MNRSAVSAIAALSFSFVVSSVAVATPMESQKMAPQAHSGGSASARKIAVGEPAPMAKEDTTRAMLSTSAFKKTTATKMTRKVPAGRSGGSASARSITIENDTAK